MIGQAVILFGVSYRTFFLSFSHIFGHLIKENVVYTPTNQTRLPDPRFQNMDDHTHIPAFVRNPSRPALIFPSPPSADPPNGLLRSPGDDDVMEK